MPKVKVTNHDFTHGKINRSLFARDDLTIYNKSAQTLENMLVMPGGSARTRFGTEYLGVIENSTGPGTPITGFELSACQVMPFSNAIGDFFILLYADENSVLSTVSIEAYRYTPDTSFPFTKITSTCTFDGGAVGDLSSLLIETATVIRQNVNSAQNQETLFIVDGVNPPYSVDATATDVLEFKTVTFKHPPVFDFKQNYGSPVSFNLSIVSIGPAVLTVFSDSCSTPYAGFFDSNYVGGVFTGLGPVTATSIGRAYILSIAPGGSQASVQIVQEFDSSYTTCSPGDDAVLTENAFTADNGFPAAVAFYENRLVFAATKKLGQSIWMSKIGQYDNFDLGLGEPDSGIGYVLSTRDDYTTIHNMISGKSLQVFTTDGEYASPAWATEGLTPGNVSIRQQTSYGSTDATPVIIDNYTVFQKKGAKAMLAFSPTTDAQTYSASDITITTDEIMAPMWNPIDFDNSDTYDGNMLLCSMKNNDSSEWIEWTNLTPVITAPPAATSSLLVFQSLLEQNVQAWSEHSWAPALYTYQIFKCGDDILLLQGNGEVSVTRLSWEHPMDMWQNNVPLHPADPMLQTFDEYSVGVPGSQAFNLSWFQVMSGLVGLTYIGDTELDGSGNVVTPIPYEDTGVLDFYIGLKFSQKLEPMPVHFMTQAGDNLYKRKRISTVWVDCFETINYSLNGIPAFNWSFPITLGAGFEPQSTITRTPILQGWDRRQSVTISQDDPFVVQILGMTLETTV